MVFDNEYALHNWPDMENILVFIQLCSFQFQFFDAAAAALHWLTDLDAAVRRLRAAGARRRRPQLEASETLRSRRWF